MNLNTFEKTQTNFYNLLDEKGEIILETDAPKDEEIYLKCNQKNELDFFGETLTDDILDDLIT